MRALGASDQDVAAYRERAKSDNLELLRANAPSVTAFFSISTTWASVIGPTGQLHRTGLRWSDVAARLDRLPAYRALDERGRDRLYDDLSVMERAALAEWARGK